ncbi:MAG: L,D-transpeptidase [Deltaproteobacteria bacterium]|nr:L,D-transpeptidase [Deltaproteobacteria bacterium]
MRTHPIARSLRELALCGLILLAPPISAASSDERTAEEMRQGQPANASDLPLDASVDPVSWLRLEINIAARELRVVEQDQIVARYRVAIGSPQWPSVEMSDDISTIIWNPSWIPPDSPWARGAKTAPPGPKNPLGPVKMPIARGVLIHGTNKPASVGQAASHGCFRMLSAEAAQLAWYLQERMSAENDPSLWEQYQHYRYRTVHVPLHQSVPVQIVYHPVEIEQDQLVLYPDIYRKVRNWRSAIETVLLQHNVPGDLPSPSTITTLINGLRKGPVRVSLDDLMKDHIATLH